MIKPVIWRNLTPTVQQNILTRPHGNTNTALKRSILHIINTVQQQGDKALVRYTQQFEKANLQKRSLLVGEQEREKAISTVPQAVKEAIDYAITNTRTVMQAQVQKDNSKEWKTVQPGVFVRHLKRPIDSVGLYVPRGHGCFPSMVYMLGVPAEIAQVKRRIMLSPPDSSGNIDPACIYAARQCGIHEIYRVGGAQAIAAMALGTESIGAVEKILGPGSIYVSMAKELLSHIVDVGPPTGPSESMVIADHSVHPYSAALDLLVEAEHGNNSSVMCITNEIVVANRIISLLPTMIQNNKEPQRSFLQNIFSRKGSIIIVDTLNTAFDIVNNFAPEHLLLHIENAEAYLPRIWNAGEILIGPYTTFSLANYAAGANAVLPTGGAAKTRSAISVQEFQKTISVVKVNKAGCNAMAPHVVTLANYEHFPNHAGALTKKPFFN